MTGFWNHENSKYTVGSDENRGDHKRTGESHKQCDGNSKTESKGITNMKTTETKMKNATDGLINTPDTAKQTAHEPEDTSTETFKAKTQTEKH